LKAPYYEYFIPLFAIFFIPLYDGKTYYIAFSFIVFTLPSPTGIVLLERMPSICTGKMARQDWTYIQISKQMGEALDMFLTTPIARKYSINDRNTLVRYLVIRFLENYQKEFGLFDYGNISTLKKSLKDR
jgi:hypothetical protein